MRDSAQQHSSSPWTPRQLWTHQPRALLWGTLGVPKAQTPGKPHQVLHISPAPTTAAPP